MLIVQRATNLARVNYLLLCIVIEACTESFSATTTSFHHRPLCPENILCKIKMKCGH